MVEQGGRTSVGRLWVLWDPGDTGEVPSGLHHSRLETKVPKVFRCPSSSPLPSLAVHDRGFGGQDGCTASLTLPLSAHWGWGCPRLSWEQGCWAPGH